MFIKFNIKRSICPPDPAIYLTLYYSLSGAPIPSSLPAFFVWKIPSSGTQSKCFPVPDLQYIKVNLIQTTLPNAEAFMWQQFLCGFIDGEKEDWEIQMKTGGGKNDLTINKMF